MPNLRNSQPPTTAPTMPSTMSRRNPSPALLTILLAMNPAMSPRMIQAMKDMRPPVAAGLARGSVGLTEGNGYITWIAARVWPTRMAATGTPVAQREEALQGFNLQLCSRRRAGVSVARASPLRREPAEGQRTNFSRVHAARRALGHRGAARRQQHVGGKAR